MALTDPVVSTPYSDIHERFLTIEADLDLFSLTVDGVHIWEWIRYDVFQEIMFSKDVWYHHEPLSRGIRDRLKGAYLLARNTVIRNPFFTPQSDLLYYGHSRRNQMDDGRWWDIYCDPIHEASDVDYQHVEEPFLNRHFRPAKTTNLRYLDLIHYFGSLTEEFDLGSVSPSERERDELRAIHDRIRSEFDIEVDVTGKALNKLRRHKATVGLYERVLNRVNPELVVLVASSGKETFISACKNLDIPVAELQHGHISEYLIEYSFPGDRTKRTFPDFLLTFGKFWNHTGAYPIDQDHVIDVGFPYLDRCKRTYADVESTNQILFMSQWMITPELSKFAVELSEQLGTDRDIVYKLHPDEYENWQRLYPWLAESGIEVADPDGRTLHRLLAESGVQVAVYSTTIFEGLSYGLDTYLVELPGVEHMTPLIERGDATLVDSPERLSEELRDSRDGAGTKPDFFRENSLNRVCEVIRGLQKGGNE
ncbi:MAG: hypothetical protein V5A27_03310 [Halapricum sp.]